MTKPAAIFGSLVDLRNVGAHHAVRLTVEVPAELAGQVIEAFGWPTQADPVPVAVARMNDVLPPLPAGPLPISHARQAGTLCRDARFQQFLGATDYDDAARKVRMRCAVKSRGELIAGSPGGALWLDLVRDFEGWLAAERAGVEVRDE